jgi:hypothetical protein
MTEYTRRELCDITRLAQLDSQARPAPDLREPYVHRVTLQPGLHLVVDASHNILLECRTPDEAELLAAYALSGVVPMMNQLELARDARDVADEEADAERWDRLRERSQQGLRAIEQAAAADPPRPARPRPPTRGEQDDEAESERRQGLAEVEEAMVLRAMLGDGKRPGESMDSLAAAMDALVRARLSARGIRYVIRRAYGHLSATFNVAGTEQLGTVTYDREAGTYAVRVPEQEKAVAEGLLAPE